MGKLDEAKQFLRAIDMPEAQQTDIAGFALLTLAGIKENMDWSLASNAWLRIHDVIEFTKIEYGKTYAENTRENIRKNAMHQFREAVLIEDNLKSTNSPAYRYRITEEALHLLQSFKTPLFDERYRAFEKTHGTLVAKYASKKKMEMMPVFINGAELRFSPGKHNALQKAIIEELAPRFAPNCECLYVGDTIKKDLIKDVDKLARLGFEITLHDKMPDVVLYREDKDWLYFIEAVTSVGPMSPQRIIEIKAMTEKVASGKIFVTAFPDFATYKKFGEALAWETEVWLSEMPDHMIHLNGDKFLGPR